MNLPSTYTTFAGNRKIVSGELKTVLSALKQHLDSEGADTVLTFIDCTGQEVDFDMRGTLEEVLGRYDAAD
ncbi:MAG TPA: DUF2239 family protein, partial [Trueperaceae bacterium]|nr:DUF2239 family protein [Trueperaceae bacterium]